MSCECQSASGESVLKYEFIYGKTSQCYLDKYALKYLDKFSLLAVSAVISFAILEEQLAPNCNYLRHFFNIV